MTRTFADRIRSWLLRSLLQAISSTWRYAEMVPDECRAVITGEQPGVVAFWHGKMLPVWYRFRHKRCSALVSASRDGELLASYLERSLGYADIVRGSSSRKGSEALNAIVSRLAERSCLITPDGPRGPACVAKPGALIAAQRSGRPIVAAHWECHRAVRFGSWDGMELPVPFARINIRYCTVNISSTTFIEHEQLRYFEYCLNAEYDTT